MNNELIEKAIEEQEEWTLPVLDSDPNIANQALQTGAWTSFAIGAVTRQVNKEREKLGKHLDKV